MLAITSLSFSCGYSVSTDIVLEKYSEVTKHNFKGLKVKPSHVHLTIRINTDDRISENEITKFIYDIGKELQEIKYGDKVGDIE